MNCVAEKFDLLREERSLGVWNFEGGGYVRIACSKSVPTAEALETIRLPLLVEFEAVKVKPYQ